MGGYMRQGAVPVIRARLLIQAKSIFQAYGIAHRRMGFPPTSSTSRQ